MSSFTSSSYNMSVHAFSWFSRARNPEQGGCWKLCSTSPVRAYITRMELNRGDGARVGSRGAPRVLSSRVRGTRGVGTPFGPTKNHPLSLSHQQAGNHEPICFLGFLRPYIMPRSLVGGYIIMLRLKACIGDSGNDTPHFYRPGYKWKHASTNW